MKMKLHGTSTSDREPRTRLVPAESAGQIPPQFVSRIDEALRAFSSRNLVVAQEVVDLLLDLRLQVVLDTTLSELLDSTHEH